MRRCLRKDVLRRQQHVGDARIEIEESTYLSCGWAITEEPAPDRNRARDNRLWMELSLAMIDAGAAALEAVDSRDPQAVLAVGEETSPATAVRACTG